MKWFKHYSDASESTSLNLIHDRLGLNGIAYYWLLIELLSEKFDGKQTTFELSLTQLLRKLRIKNSRTFTKVVQNFNETLEIEIKVLGKVVSIKYSKLLEIKDNHTSRTSKLLKSNLALEKEKEKEEEKEKDKHIRPRRMTYAVNCDQVFEAWNTICSHCLSSAKVLSEARKRSIRSSIKQNKQLQTIDGWIEYFNLILESPFLLGQGNRGWKASFEWAIKSNSYCKVIEGSYSSASKGQASLNQTLNLINNNPYETGE